MPTTSWQDFTAGVREIPNRTDSAGASVDDLPLREDQLVNVLLTEGVVTPAAAFEPSKGTGDFDVDFGSGSSGADIFVVESDVTGQQPYIVTLEQTSVTVTLDAADADPRIDEVYLVVRDDGVDSNSDGHRLPRLGYRKGDSATSDPSAPGADANWENYALLATISVSGGATSISAGDITDERVDSQFLQRVFDEAVRNTAASVFGAVLDSRYAELSGDTFAGAVDMGSNKITSLANPTAGTDALNRQTGDSRYADDPHTHAEHDSTVPRITTGSYTGDGTSTRTIDVGFQPSLVVVRVQGTPIGEHMGVTVSTAGGMTMKSNGDNQQTTTFKVVSSGFQVGGSSGSFLNTDAETYEYTAFG